MGVKGLIQYIYIYIYIYIEIDIDIDIYIDIYNNSNLTTALRRCYVDDVRLFNKAKNLPYLSVTGLLFNFDFLT